MLNFIARRALCVGALTVGAACTPSQMPTAKPAPVRTGPVIKARAHSYPKDPAERASFVQHFGQALSSALPPAEGTVIGRLNTPSGIYVHFRAHHDASVKGIVLVALLDGKRQPLLAAVTGMGWSNQSLDEGDNDFVLRVPNDYDISNLSTVEWAGAMRGSSPSKLHGGMRQFVHLSNLATAPMAKDLEERMGLGLARWFEIAMPEQPFAAFASARVRRRWTPRSAHGQDTRHQDNHDPTLSELMDFFTARSALEDSLQTRRGLALTRKTLPRTQALRSLIPKEAADSEEQAREAGSTTCPGCGPLSGQLPFDSLVVEFATIKDLVQLPRVLDEKLGAIVRIMEGTGGPQHILERYREQLALEFEGFSETVGQFAARTAAVAFSDPYLREGSDVLLVLEAENPSLLAGVLDSHLRRAKARFPDVRESVERIEGQPVILNASPDGRIRRYEYSVGSLRFISNSRAAIGRALRVQQHKLRSIAGEPDYASARRASPFDPKAESAFVYFGTGFVANVVGPRAKIAEARRLRARAELAAVDHAALLFAWVLGRPPKSATEMLQSGWLEASELTHSDGGAITWTPQVGAHSSWGFAQLLTPLVDLPIDRVSADEATAYRYFRQRYEAELNGILDPMSLRFARTVATDEVTTELSVYPIAIGGRFNSEFRHVTELTRGATIQPGPISPGVSTTFGIGDQSPLREWANLGLGEFFTGRDLSVSFVGDWIKVGIDEGPVLWDVAGQEHLISQTGDAPSTRALAIDETIPRLPIWLAVHVKSHLLLSGALATVRSKLESSSGSFAHWHDDETYRDVRISRVGISDGGEVAANVYYAVVKDVLLVTLRRDTLKARVNEVLDGRVPQGDPSGKSPYQLTLDASANAQGWLQRTLQALLDTQARIAHEKACSGLAVVSRAYGPLPGSKQERQRLFVRLLGYEPTEQLGGELRYEAGECHSDFLGSPSAPTAPNAEDPHIPLHQLVRNISAARFELGVRARGESLELKGRMQLSGPPPAR